MLCTSPSRAALLGEDTAQPRAAGSQAGKEVTRDWHPGLSRTAERDLARRRATSFGQKLPVSGWKCEWITGMAAKVLAGAHGQRWQSVVETPGAVPDLAEGMAA